MTCCSRVGSACLPVQKCSREGREMEVDLESRHTVGCSQCSDHIRGGVAYQQAATLRILSHLPVAASLVVCNC